MKKNIKCVILTFSYDNMCFIIICRGIYNSISFIMAIIVNLNIYSLNKDFLNDIKMTVVP